MKKFQFLKPTILVLVILGMMFSAFGIQKVQASARSTSWIVSITYQNVGTATTTNLVANFYPEGSSTAIAYPLANLAAGAASSLYIGSVTDITGGFRGNAILSADQPLVATVVQFHSNAAGETIKMRMLSNGFTAADGSNQYLIASTLANTYERTSIFSIQNIEEFDIKATINFYDSNTGALAATKNYTIPANSSKYIEMDDTSLTGLPSSTFNGSAIVTAVKASDGTTPAKVVSSVSDLYTTRNVGDNFEGVPLSRASKTVFMPTGLCQSFGLDTYYAIQNASLDTSTNVTITYYNADGSVKSTDGPYTLKKGQKKSVGACTTSSGTNMAGFSGSAKIVSDTTPVVAMGKAQLSAKAPVPGQADLFTAFIGEASGSSKLALPFVRYANNTNYNASNNYGTKQRAYLAIQNVGDTTANVDVSYIDKAGNVVVKKTYTIKPYAKANSDASLVGALGKNGMVSGEFGYYTDGSFGGGVIIEANAANPNAKFIAIARVQNPGAGEDYNAVSIEQTPD